MDRIIQKKKYKGWKFGLSILGAGCLLFAVYSFSSANYGVPHVEIDKIRIGEVKRGAMDVVIPGTGEVAARDPDWIVATTPGRVVKSPFKGGELVSKGEVLVELINEDTVSDLAQAKSELLAAQKDLTALRLDLGSRLIDYESKESFAQLEMHQEQRIFDALNNLKLKGTFPVAELDFVKAEVSLDQKKSNFAAAKKQLERFKEIRKATLEAAEFRLASLQEETTRLEKRVKDLAIVASNEGIIQNLNLKVGQGVEAGEPIAQIVDPTSLYVALKVPAAHAFKISPNLKAKIEINRNIYDAYVHRIDPNVKGASVDVDIYFDSRVESLKVGMFVNGQIYIKSIDDTLFVDIPAHATENSEMSVFVLSEKGDFARLSQINSGFLSANHLQVLNGLNAGDKIILSDVLSKSAGDQLRIK